MFPLQLLLDLIGIIFIDIEDHQMPDPVFCQLGTDLTTDGSAASGYKNGFSFDIAKDFIQVDFDRSLPSRSSISTFRNFDTLTSPLTS